MKNWKLKYQLNRTVIAISVGSIALSSAYSQADNSFSLATATPQRISILDPAYKFQLSPYDVTDLVTNIDHFNRVGTTVLNTATQPCVVATNAKVASRVVQSQLNPQNKTIAASHVSDDYEITPSQKGPGAGDLDFGTNKKTGSTQKCSMNSGLFRFFAQQASKFSSKSSDVEVATTLGHYMAMSVQESNGKIIDITDMHYNEIKPKVTNISSFKDLSEAMDSAQVSDNRTFFDFMNPFSAKRKPVKINSQTNFGLLQMSADQLPGKRSAFSKKSEISKSNLALITKYQNWAKSDPAGTIQACGTDNFLNPKTLASQQVEIQKEFQELSSCTPGNDSKDHINCFGKWVMLCPSLNFAIALHARPAYFQSWRKAPICTHEFTQLIKDIRSE